MRKDRCPHCHKYGFHVWKMNEEIAAILTCRYCNELSLLFKGRVIPLNKGVLESGTLEERKMHLAEVIGILLEAGLLDFSRIKDSSDYPFHKPHQRKRSRNVSQEPSQTDLISDQEMERFLQVDLERLDNPAYFKRIFG